MKRTLLIDGDTLIYAAASASEYEVQWDHDLWTLHSDFAQAKGHFEEDMAALIEFLKPSNVIVALSCTGLRWRNAVMPTYKAKRGRKPIVYRALREYVSTTYSVYERPTLEGDDVLGILATHPTLIAGEKIIVSIDKDMNTLPGWHLNYAHARGTPDYEALVRFVTEAEADRYHLFQTLTGDSTDGYPGCPGVGKVTAEKILTANANNPWDGVLAAYAKAKLGVEIALQNARVARICRHTDYDFDKKAVILWQPPT